MNILLKIVLLASLLVVVATAVVVPLVFHFRNKNESETNPGPTSSTNSTSSTTTRSTTTSSTSISQRLSNTTSSVMSSTTVTTSRSNVNTTVTATSQQRSIYSSALTNTSARYCRSAPCSTELNFYEAIQITVNVTGSYTIRCNSTMDTYGFIYNQTFDPNSVATNKILSDDDTGNNGQFLITLTASQSGIYVLVATTYSTEYVGPFLISSTGLGWTTFVKLNTSLYTAPPTLASTTTTTTVAPSSFTQASSALNSTSPVFCRASQTCNTPSYYYNAFSLNVTESGIFTIVSNSSIDMYGYLYNNTFNATNAEQNLLASDDDGAGSRDFLISFDLQRFSRYVVVATTFDALATGRFSLTVAGNSPLNMARIS